MDAARDYGAFAVCAEPFLAAGNRGRDSRDFEYRDHAAFTGRASGTHRSGSDGGGDGRISGAVCDGAYGKAQMAEAGVRGDHKYCAGAILRSRGRRGGHGNAIDAGTPQVAIYS